MPLNIYLIDKNPMIEKTLSYFLHQYQPNLQYFTQWPEQDDLSDKPVDIVFIDTEQARSELLKDWKEKNATPVILTYTDPDHISSFISDSIQYEGILKKPINCSELLEIISSFVPFTNDLTLTSYLKHYERPEPSEESADTPTAPKNFQPSIINSENLDFSDGADINKIKTTTASFKKISDKITNITEQANSKKLETLNSVDMGYTERMIEEKIQKYLEKSQQTQENQKLLLLKSIQTKLDQDTSVFITQVIEKMVQKILPEVIKKIREDDSKS